MSYACFYDIKDSPAISHVLYDVRDVLSQYDDILKSHSSTAVTQRDTENQNQPQIISQTSLLKYGKDDSTVYLPVLMEVKGYIGHIRAV